jgi:archaemetzincin
VNWSPPDVVAVTSGLSSPSSLTPEPETACDPEPQAPRSNVPGVDCVYIQSLGSVPESTVRTVKVALEATYGVEIKTGPRRALPKDTYYKPRKRYRADRLLDHLDSWLPRDCDRIVGLTRKDISATKSKHKDWGILGLGRVEGKSCVVSSFRTRKKLGKVPMDERLARVAIHELGHTLAQDHCPNFGCLMEDAGGSVVTIDRETNLCERCQGLLKWRGDPPQERP